MAVNLRQTHFRFGKDDGTEATHTFWQLVDVNHTQLITADWTFLLRFTEQETGNTAAGNTDAQFQYNKNGTGWVDITTTSSVVKAVAVNAFADGQNCTKRLSGTGTFETTGAGCTEDGLSGGNANDIAALGNSETEAGLQVVASQVANGDTIQFRFTSPDWTVGYDVTPTLTIQKSGTYNEEVSLITSGGLLESNVGKLNVNNNLNGNSSLSNNNIIILNINQILSGNSSLNNAPILFINKNLSIDGILSMVKTGGVSFDNPIILSQLGLIEESRTSNIDSTISILSNTQLISDNFIEILTTLTLNGNGLLITPVSDISGNEYFEILSLSGQGLLQNENISKIDSNINISAIGIITFENLGDLFDSIILNSNSSIENNNIIELLTTLTLNGNGLLITSIPSAGSQYFEALILSGESIISEEKGMAFDTSINLEVGNPKMLTFSNGRIYRRVLGKIYIKI